jgi:hypothetical protein
MSRDSMFPSLDAMFPDVNEDDVVGDGVARANANTKRRKAMRGKGITMSISCAR